MKKNRVTVAEYLTQQINISGVAQKEIAQALGYEKPNIITMFKQGKTKVPINKIAPLAKILGVDPIHFLRVAMLEYSPETWNAIEAMVGARLVTENEQKILDIARSAAGGQDIAPKNEEQERQLSDIFSAWTKEAEAAGKPATRTEA